MKLTMTLCAAAIAICGALSAQPATTVDQVKVHFSTPVEVGDATIAAGDCSMRLLRGSSDNLVLALRPESGSAVFVLVNRFAQPVNSTEPGKSAQVVLSRHGNDYRLERILMPDRSGFEVTGPVD